MRPISLLTNLRTHITRSGAKGTDAIELLALLGTEKNGSQANTSRVFQSVPECSRVPERTLVYSSPLSFVLALKKEIIFHFRR